MEYHRLNHRGYASSVTYPPWNEPADFDYVHHLAEPSHGHHKSHDHRQDEEKFQVKMENILSAYPCFGVPREPSQLINNVYVGTNVNAENLGLLRKFKIGYVLNCAGGNPTEFRRMRELYGQEDGILGYEELCLEDNDHCNIRDYFERAHGFIDYGRRNARVLIYCPGVSRSGAIAISYLISSGRPLLEATREVKDCRRVALCNSSFMQQLVAYARDRGMLDYDLASVPGDRMGGRFYRYRINAASIPRTTPLEMKKKYQWW